MSELQKQTKVYFRIEQEGGGSVEINLPLEHTWVQYTINLRRGSDGTLRMTGPDVEILKD